MHNPQGARWRGQRLGAVLFDLDGTLLDTVADIALALNRTMVEYDCKPLAEGEVRRMIGRGPPILIERAADSLRILHDAGLRTAVVTNKEHRFAGALLQRLGLADWVDVVVGGDTCARRKPDPQHLLFACESLQVPPSQSLMVGDSVNDVQAARAAGIPVVCVSYGYNEGRDPRTLECDMLLDSLTELPALLQVT